MTRIAVFGPLGEHGGGRGIGGVATHTIRIATALASQGHEVAVIADDLAGKPGSATPAAWGWCFGTLGATKRQYVTISPALVASGARAIGDTRRSGLDLPLARCMKRSALLATALKSFRPDVLHVQQPESRPLYAEWSGTRVPTLLCVHGSTGAPWNASDPGRDVVVPENLLRAQAISTPSHFLAREIQRLAPGAPEASIAPNGVDTELFRPRERTACRQELDIDPDVPLVVYAGRITEAKGVFDLADALPMIQKLVPTARCAFLGPVDSSSRALAVPRRGDAPSSSAFLVPATDQREVALWMGAADIVVVPSHYEGFGLAALEAMASARPVVASAVGGLCEFVDDTVGSLVPSAEPAKLADAVAALLLAPDRAAALGAAGYQRASAFTWSATANLLAAAYDQLISEARR